jgi:RNA polymerase sigma-54 factor
MGLETRLLQKLSQNLLMTPQLQQAIKLLQLGRFEYVDAIQKELLENPLLEEIKDSTLKASVERSSFEQEDALKGFSDKAVSDSDHFIEQFHDSGRIKARKKSGEDSRTSFEENITSQRTFEEDLIDQIRYMDLCENQKIVLNQLIGNLDNRGYLMISLDDTAKTLNVNLEEVKEAHATLLTLDPPGVGARDLRECLLVQLQRKGRSDSIEEKIVLHHLDLVEKRKYELIAKKLSTTKDKIFEAIKLILLLDPYPSRQYEQEGTRYITPDVYIRRDGSDYVVVLNDEGIPNLKINSHYSKLLKKQKDKHSQSYLSERTKSATWILRSIDQRQRTIFKTTESIIKFQKDFLDQGIEFLKPLVLKDVAEDIGMHESTVSRITSNKYVHTPHGIFELKYFFSAGIKTSDGELSSSAIKEKIRQLIQTELAKTPISDQRIVEILQEQNIEIARRTVAKYRESMGILPSAKRKRVF